jgi:hypothetical protein
MGDQTVEYLTNKQDETAIWIRSICEWRLREWSQYDKKLCVYSTTNKTPEFHNSLGI